jgi:NitT/TauT family transport system substrate-binding protein
MHKVVTALAAVITLCFSAGAQAEATKVKLAFCSKTMNIAAAPVVIASKMGWFQERGIDVEMVLFGGSTECIQNLATGEVDFSNSTADALAMVRSRGVVGKVFYTLTHLNIFGLAVPEDSPIKSVRDLKGKTIGVTSMASTGVLTARAIAAANGLDPDKDLQFAATGEAGQSAALIRSKQVDALSQFSTQYALLQYLGINLRMLDNSAVASFPSNGLVALDKTLKTKRKEAIALARGYAMGTLFSLENPAAASRIVFEAYPESRATGRDEATSIQIDKVVLESTRFALDIDKLGKKYWGEGDIQAYANYLKFLKQWDVIKSDIDVKDFVTNDLIPEINDFDRAAVVKAAKEYGKK